MAPTSHLLLYLLLFYVFVSCVFGSRLSPRKSTVYGPGVDPKRQPLPMEYFYVQLVNEEGKK